MQIEHEQLDGRVLKIKLSGRMDAGGSEEIDSRLAALTAQPGIGIIVDLSNVAFLASIGIRTLLVYAKALAARGGRMVLLNPDAGVAKVLEVSGLDTMIGVFRDLDAACTAVTAKPAGAA